MVKSHNGQHLRDTRSAEAHKIFMQQFVNIMMHIMMDIYNFIVVLQSPSSRENTERG